MAKISPINKDGRVLYHYTDDEGAQRIIRSGTIQASLKNNVNNGDTALGNGVYLTEWSPFSHSKDEIEMNNWTRRTPETRRKLKNYFAISIPECDITKSKSKTRNIFRFGYGNDLRLHKYPWMLVDFNSEKILASYKYRVIASGPAGSIDYTIGDYAMTDEIVNGRPVYKKSVDEYLYIGSKGAWFLGPFIGSDGGYLFQKSSYSLGPDTDVPWEHCHPKKLRFVDHTMAVRPFGKRIFMNFDLAEVADKVHKDMNFLQHVSKTSDGNKVMVVKSILRINEDVECPVAGMTVLHNKNIVIAYAKSDTVKMIKSDGTLVYPILSVRPFKNPTDLITLSTGEFVVRDDVGLQLFTENGFYLRTLRSKRASKCYGLAEDEEGYIITINLPKPSSKAKEKEAIRTEVLFISRESGAIITRINLMTPVKSKCNFQGISCHNRTIYLNDLGNNCIRKLNIDQHKYVGKFGETGTGPKQFLNPAGIVFDDMDNFIVADSRNHRLQIFDYKEDYIGLVEVDVDMFCSPSSIYLDKKEKELYVLNYWGNSIVKYRITC